VEQWAPAFAGAGVSLSACSVGFSPSLPHIPANSSKGVPMPDTLATRDRRADPVITEIVRSGVLAVTGEMKTNLMRTAYNLIIYEALAFTGGLFTADGRTVSIGLGLPMFIRGMGETIKAELAHFKGDIQPGDILITNDAYITGSHLNHVTLSLPIFHKGRLVRLSCCM